MMMMIIMMRDNDNDDLPGSKPRAKATAWVSDVWLRVVAEMLRGKEGLASCSSSGERGREGRDGV